MGKKKKGSLTCKRIKGTPRNPKQYVKGENDFGPRQDRKQPEAFCGKKGRGSTSRDADSSERKRLGRAPGKNKKRVGSHRFVRKKKGKTTLLEGGEGTTPLRKPSAQNGTHRERKGREEKKGART